jgi:signal transduction histidine kinase
MVGHFEGMAQRKETFFTQEDLNAIVQNTLEILQPEIEDKGIRLVRSLYPHPIIGRFNKNMLRIALAHLLRNAIDATGVQGEIHLTTAVERSLAEVIVLDTG